MDNRNKNMTIGLQIVERKSRDGRQDVLKSPVIMNSCGVVAAEDRKV